MVASPRHVPVSIVCVYNDPAVRRSCLDRSVDAGLAQAPDTEYLPIDNTARQYPSAGAALNAGIRQARHEVVVLVHQDVYLHSLPALERAAAALVDSPDVGLVGAVGITGSGAVAGVVRDRVVMIGESASSTDVDSVDEVLFMIERDRAVADPLSEDPDLAWHAYAVEYGARVRDQGLRVVATDLPLTHNSMTVNLDRLAEAHARVAALHPGDLPMQTTCGVVREARQRSRWRTVLRRRRGAAAWLRESVLAARLAPLSGARASDVALADIRLDIDDALELLAAPSLEVVNLDPLPGSPDLWTVDGLSRRGRTVSARAGDAGLALTALTARRADDALLLTGVDRATMTRLGPALRGTPHLVGVARDTGAWVLCHPEAPRVRSMWPGRRNAAFGRRPRAARAVADGAPADLAG
ncbi:MAG: glycosyltransferase family protein [Actinomycetales bacterium]|nr:glycosyltransferase family protein [Actinomycetales bacterium]